jgi:hypothetical protein
MSAVKFIQRAYFVCDKWITERLCDRLMYYLSVQVAGQLSCFLLPSLVHSDEHFVQFLLEQKLSNYGTTHFL